MEGLLFLLLTDKRVIYPCTYSCRLSVLAKIRMTWKAKVTHEYRLVFQKEDSDLVEDDSIFCYWSSWEIAALVDTAAISYNHMYIYCPTELQPIHILWLHRKPLSGTINIKYQRSSTRFTQRWWIVAMEEGASSSCVDRSPTIRQHHAIFDIRFI